METLLETLKTKISHLTTDEQQQILSFDNECDADQERLIKECFFDCVYDRDICTETELYQFLERYCMELSEGDNDKYGFIRQCIELDLEDHIEDLEKED